MKKQNIIVINPGAGGKKYSIRWPKDKFIKLIDRLPNKFKIVIVGSKHEIALSNQIKRKTNKKPLILTGKTNLNQLAYLLEIAQVVISNDTGTMHLAAAMGTKTIGLFGPDTPVRYAPFNKISKSLYKPSKCSPCRKAYLNEWKKCGNPICLRNISVDDVLESVQFISK